MNRTETPHDNVLANENGGVVIITAILVLVVLSILGISATDTTITEKHIAINDQRSKIAFFHADGAIFATIKLISHALDTPASADKIIPGSTDAPGITYLSGATDPHEEFYDQIAEFAVHDPDKDIDFFVGNLDADSEVEFLDPAHTEGGGVEFLMEAEGIGYTVVAKDYLITANGYHNRNAKRITDRALSAWYRKLVGFPGGM
ncbi:MAG: hypothetical protein CR984_03970 [Proteobacteria bacterium]|nr:MAG: hypothetical protein CR984_03970 [Pseudomonadota bacterium]